MQNITRNLLLLERIAIGPPATQAELADELGFSRSTISDLLRDLRALGYVTLRNRSYSPGLRLSTFIMRARNGPTLAIALQTVLRRLAEQTGETALCAVLVVGPAGSLDVLSIDQVQSTQDLRYVATFNRLYPAAASVTGQVILAFGKHADRLPPGMAGQIRARGYGILENDERGATILSAPVLDEQGEPLAAISVIGPAHRMNCPELNILPHLRDAVGELARARGMELDEAAVRPPRAADVPQRART